MSRFFLSLDFELMWGLRDHHTISTYGESILGGRAAIPEMLEIFDKNRIHATWATVGLLFCKTKNDIRELIRSIKAPDYADQRLSNYTYFDEIGANESVDQYYFGYSIVDRILQTDGQEIGTHTFSHYYCLEPGAETDTFASDLDAAILVARERSVSLKSIVFPRNQYSQPFLEICAARGLTSFRGNPGGYAYRTHRGAENTTLRRGLRLVDAYTGALNRPAPPDQTAPPGIRNVPATRFLRPAAGRLARLHAQHLRTILSEMTRAAKQKRDYHLWWHPHNFGLKTDLHLSVLKTIIDHHIRLRDDYGVISACMKDA